MIWDHIHAKKLGSGSNLTACFSGRSRCLQGSNLLNIIGTSSSYWFVKAGGTIRIFRGAMCCLLTLGLRLNDIASEKKYFRSFPGKLEVKLQGNGWNEIQKHRCLKYLFSGNYAHWVMLSVKLFNIYCLCLKKCIESKILSTIKHEFPFGINKVSFILIINKHHTWKKGWKITQTLM